jgi:hypothetical protein
MTGTAHASGRDIGFMLGQPDEVVPEIGVKDRTLLRRVQVLSRRLPESRTGHEPIGETFYFCAPGCRKTFLAAAVPYVNR